MPVPRQIIQKLNNLAVMTNESRFSILLFLFNSDVLKIGNSLTFKELQEGTGFDKPNLSYHLKLLKRANLIGKKPLNSRYYSIKPEGKRLIKLLGISSSDVKRMSKKYL